jgi:16S rRNA C1402 N4-methylase RsmH
VRPTDSEVVSNPRARSARLRIAQRETLEQAA